MAETVLVCLIHRRHVPCFAGDAWGSAVSFLLVSEAGRWCWYEEYWLIFSKET